MSTLEKVTVKIFALNPETDRNPYVITFETTVPFYQARNLHKRIEEVLREEFVAEGVENIQSNEKRPAVDAGGLELKYSAGGRRILRRALKSGRDE